VRTGGSIGFNCGGAAVTIALDQTLYTCNTTACGSGGSPVNAMTLDGGGKVTLSGGGARGIFYAASCADTDKLGWVSGRCDFTTNTYPRITFKNIAFANGNSPGYPAPFTGSGPGVPGGGGAILMIGGTLTLQNVDFRNNQCMAASSDGGGGAVRAWGMPNPVTVSGSRFESNHCANGGAISTLQAPVTITGSTFTGNAATGHGNNSGLGGNGGAIYMDGRGEPLRISGTTMTGNTSNGEGGSAIFYYANDDAHGDGTFSIAGSTLSGNTGQSFGQLPGIWYGDVSAGTVRFSATSSSIS
jgi:hypothetical protein